MKTLITICALVALLFTGCTTVFKTTATVAISAEKASDAWLNYYVAAKRQPGANLAALEAQDAKAAKAWGDYQKAMDSVYFARKAYVAGTETPEQLKATVDAAALASGNFVSLILNLLPAEQAKAIK